MTIQQLSAFCESFAGVSCDYPFGSQPRCCRIGGKIFAEIYPEGVPGALAILSGNQSFPREAVVPMATLRCEPLQGDFYKQQFSRSVFRPYHCPPAQQPYALTVLLNGGVPDQVLKEMARHAYEIILKKIPLKKQREIFRGTSGQ